MKRKIGILGGTFDPLHLGHLIIANEVLDRLGLDEVKFMPNHEPPHKDRHTGTTAENRLAMLERAIEGHPKFSIETIELNQAGRSYTYDTMKILREKNPQNDYYFIIGADMVEYLPHWYNIEKLVKIVQFVGTNRPHNKLESPYPVKFVEVPMIDISSSMIRDRIKKGMSIKYLLPDQVIRYIEENDLYES